MAISEGSAPRLPRDSTTVRGRPPDPNREAAILQAALEGLAEHGYDRLTMDEIAALAHAGKGALYRRWPSKAAIVVDAVIAWRLARAPAGFQPAERGGACRDRGTRGRRGLRGHGSGRVLGAGGPGQCGHSQTQLDEIG